MAPRPHNVPFVRVLVAGDAGCGKSTLCTLLASSSSGDDTLAPARTQGADVHVRLVHTHSPSGPCFVELWDLSGDDDTYGHLLPVVIQAAGHVGGLVLCHDLSSPAGAAVPSLVKWARLCGSHATWACPPPQTPPTPLAARLRDLGVAAPALVLGLKADSAPPPLTPTSSLPSLLLSLLLLPLHRAVNVARAALRRLSGSGKAGGDDATATHRLPDFITREQRDAALFTEATLCCSPGYGRVDVDALDAFFKHIIGQCASAGADGALMLPLGHHRHKRSWSGASSSGGSFDFGVASPAELATPVALRAGAARGLSLLRTGSQSNLQHGLGCDGSPMERDIEGDGRLTWADDHLQQRSPHAQDTKARPW